jgi:hypothetical protein
LDPTKFAQNESNFNKLLAVVPNRANSLRFRAVGKVASAVTGAGGKDVLQIERRFAVSSDVIQQTWSDRTLGNGCGRAHTPNFGIAPFGALRMRQVLCS